MLLDVSKSTFYYKKMYKTMQQESQSSMIHGVYSKKGHTRTSIGDINR